MSRMHRIVAGTALASVIVVSALVWYSWRPSSRAAAPQVTSSDRSKAETASASPRSAIRNTAAQWPQADGLASAAAFAQLQSLAATGDVAAQRGLAEMYQRCAMFSLSPSKMYSMLDTFARMRGVPESAYGEIKKRFASTCSGVDGGQIIPRDAYMGWFDLAARGGDAYSKVAAAANDLGSVKDEDYQLIARDVVNSSDPEAIFALGDLLAVVPESADLAEFKPLASGPYATYAWGIVACRMGADCGAESYRMDSFCINTGICNAGGFEDAIRSQAVPSGQQEALDKAIRDVQEVVDKRR